MIVNIKNKAIENFFQKGKGLSGFTVGQKEEMRYWLSILHAVSSKEDFSLSGGKFYKVRLGYQLDTDLGSFKFDFCDQGIKDMDFQLKA